MRNLHLIALLALFASMASFAVFAQEPQACEEKASGYTPLEERYESGMIFRMEKCGKPVNYIMGTMHLDDPGITPIYRAAVQILPQVEAAGFEFVEDERTTIIAQQYLFYPPTQPAGLSALITPQEMAKLGAEVQARTSMPSQATDRLRPWAAAVLLQFPPPSSDGIALDKRLQQQAQLLGKTLFSLETPAEQYEIFAAIPTDQQIGMLKDTLTHIKEIDAINKQLLETYIARDLLAMQDMANASIILHGDVALQDYLQEKLIEERNHLMVRRMQPRLHQGPALVAIGALHLMGEQGIIPLLEAQGWRFYTEF